MTECSTNWFFLGTGQVLGIRSGQVLRIRSGQVGARAKAKAKVLPRYRRPKKVRKLTYSCKRGCLVVQILCISTWNDRRHQGSIRPPDEMPRDAYVTKTKSSEQLDNTPSGVSYQWWTWSLVFTRDDYLLVDIETRARSIRNKRRAISCETRDQQSVLVVRQARTVNLMNRSGSAKYMS